MLSFDSCVQLKQKLEEFAQFYSELRDKVTQLKDQLTEFSENEEENRERIVSARKSKLQGLIS